MKKKLGPLPVWAWALIGGGTIGAVILWQKSKAKTAATETAVQGPELGGQAEGEGGGGGASGSAGLEAKDSSEASLLREELQFVEEHPTNNSTQGSSFVEQLESLRAENGLLQEVTGGQNAQTKEGGGNSAVKAATGKAGTSLNTQAGNPRQGLSYKTVTYKGKTAHEYLTAIKGGVGPKGNLIILPGAATATHAVTPSHAAAPAPAPATIASASSQQNTAAGNPRAGKTYKTVTYKGKAAHEYAGAIAGGVGPKKNLVIV